MAGNPVTMAGRGERNPQHVGAPRTGASKPIRPAGHSASGAPVRGAHSLRVIVPAAAALLLTAALLGAAMISERNARDLLVRELETRLVLEARNLALTSSSALLEGFPELVLQPIVNDLLAGRRELEFAAVLDHRGMIRGHPDARAVGQPWTDPAGLTPVTGSVRLRDGERLLGSRESLVAIAPVQHATGKRLGTAIVVMRRGYLDAAIADARSRMWMLFAGVLVAGALVTPLFMSRLLQPISALRAGLERIGHGDLETRLELRDRTELGLLADTVNTMTGALRAAQRQAIEKERLASELELARRIQESLLPARRVERHGCVLVGSHRAAAEVGGDYFDLLPLPDGRVALAIADVSGKGLAGCMVMSMLSVVLHALRATHESPTALLVAVEENLVRTLSRGGFVTMFYGVLDPRTGRLTFASAGHLPALVWRARERQVEWRRSTAVPIGAIRTGALRTMLTDESLTLEPGDLLLQLTDGFTEAADPHGEQFGFDRVEQVVRGHVDQGPDAVLRALSQAVVTWSGEAGPRDDETALVVFRAGAPLEKGGLAKPAMTRRDIPSAQVEVDEEAGVALAVLERARRGGCHLSLGTELVELAGLRAWIQECPDLSALDPGAARLLESALYESCANVMEHGYAGDHDARFDVWWVPPETTRAAGAAERVREGCVLIRERGRAWDPTRHGGADLSDPRVRRRGRGFGIEMIRRIMRSVEYYAATPEGNLTILRFDPAAAGALTSEA